MIALEHISMQFGGDYLFRDVTFTIRPDDRMGLVGPNGAGKTTLMRIMARVYEPESGSINTPTGYTIGYLPQEPTLDDAAQKRSLLKEALRAREDLIQIEEELEEIQIQLETNADDHASEAYAKILDRFGVLHHRYEDQGGFELESQAQKILVGLGFKESDFEKQVYTFSGGWQMRLLLAKLLIAHPNALLLDEPTNHLDLESLIWLEDFLNAYDGLILIVSHDRTFLNSITNRTAEIDRSKIEVYAGNYDYYEKTKAERLALLEAQAASLAQKRKEIESFVERFRYKATKAKQAQSRLKMLERMERIELSTSGPTVHFTFPAAQPSGRSVFEIEHGAKSFDRKHQVFQDVDIRIERGERIAFLGKNGMGKTTLGRILAGQDKLTHGELKPGYNVTIGYYAQHQAEALDPNITVLETVEAITRAQFFHGGAGATKGMSQLRALLGAFLFQGDDVFKPVRVLSGGEKARLALAKMLLEPSNTLIMDEPTNHLDMRSKEVVKEALLAFEGTVIVISHDRDFLDDLVDRVITFGDGRVKDYMYPLDQYLDELHEKELKGIQSKKSEARAEKAKAKVAEQAPPKVEAIQPNRNGKSQSAQNGKASASAKIETRDEQQERKRREAEVRNQKAQREKPLRNEIQKIEQQIATCEAEKQMLEDSMLDPDYYTDPARVKSGTEKLVAMKSKLDQLFFQWSELNEKLERVGV